MFSGGIFANFQPCFCVEYSIYFLTCVFHVKLQYVFSFSVGKQQREEKRKKEKPRDYVTEKEKFPAPTLT